VDDRGCSAGKLGGPPPPAGIGEGGGAGARDSGSSGLNGGGGGCGGAGDGPCGRRVGGDSRGGGRVRSPRASRGEKSSRGDGGGDGARKGDPAVAAIEVAATLVPADQSPATAILRVDRARAPAAEAASAAAPTYLMVGALRQASFAA